VKKIKTEAFYEKQNDSEESDNGGADFRAGLCYCLFAGAVSL
jgi:hypothetical protein